MASTALLVSRPLCKCLEAARAAPAWDALKAIDGTLEAIGVDHHLRAVVIFQSDHTYIDFEASSEFGKEVLREVGSQLAITPCPPEDHDFDGDRDDCMWCGTTRRRAGVP